MTPTRPPRPWTGLLALAGAFVSGGGLVLLAAQRPPAPDAPPEVEVEASSAPDLFADLDLTPDQRAAVDSILGRTRAVVDSVFQASTDAYRVEAERAWAGILDVLDPEQGRVFAERVESAGPMRIRRVQVGDSIVREDTLPPSPLPEPGGR